MTLIVDNGALSDFTAGTEIISSEHYQNTKPRWGPIGTATAWDDPTPPPVRAPRVATASVTQVADAAVATTLAAANAARLGLIVENLSTAALYLKFGAGASVVSHSFRLLEGDVWEMAYVIYTGIVTGIWAADAGGFAYVTEV